jgi:hypothetical protein
MLNIAHKRLAYALRFPCGNRPPVWSTSKGKAKLVVCNRRKNALCADFAPTTVLVLRVLRLDILNANDAQKYQ